MAAVKSTNKSGPLTERERLREQLASATAFKATAQAEVAALAQKYGGAGNNGGWRKLHAVIAAAHLGVAKGTTPPAELAKAQDDLARVESEHAAAIERIAVANTAIRELRDQVADLHEREADVFAADSAQLAAAAEADLAALTDAYNKSRTSWEAARASYGEWTPDVPEVSSCPAWPLPSVEVLSTPCRPVDVRR
ncbi:hypothetical protein FSW04_09905 [Baekduia soli]|uniref:Uncharacterized protein n=1 Tax=Baekduia soli TaxID=496014 RepID=A0A5B8U480_9ACTN|nr:hypothetical protein [Baekduia soli]QEC47853.1 hypothetical protein FSW04_09905 [Baekduia soli]